MGGYSEANGWATTYKSCSYIPYEVCYYLNRDDTCILHARIFPKFQHQYESFNARPDTPCMKPEKLALEDGSRVHIETTISNYWSFPISPNVPGTSRICIYIISISLGLLDTHIYRFSRSGRIWVVTTHRLLEFDTTIYNVQHLRIYVDELTIPRLTFNKPVCGVLSYYLRPWCTRNWLVCRRPWLSAIYPFISDLHSGCRIAVCHLVNRLPIIKLD